MSFASHTDGELVKSLKTLWNSLDLDEQILGGLWWNDAPEQSDDPYAAIESESNTKVLTTSDGALYRWEFTINLYLSRPDTQDAEEVLKTLVKSVDRIAGNRLQIAGSTSLEISREDDVTFNTGDEQVVQALLKYSVVH